MNSLLILIIGMLVVVGGVLLLRLHAFLALIFGALVVAMLTPSTAIYDQELRGKSTAVVTVDSGTSTVCLKAGKSQPVIEGKNVLLRPPADSRRLESIGLVTIGTIEKKAQGMVVAQIDEGAAAIQAGDRIVHHTLAQTAQEAAGQTMGARVAEGFGDTCLQIGILIAMAAIIGKCLLDSGAAERIVLTARRMFGDRQAPLAFMGSGFLVGIPVFFDTVFYLLMPLGKALRVRTGRDYLLYVLAITCGATMAHSLVPPTPGPLFVASELGVDIGLMMLGGCVVGLFTVSAGYMYALWANRRWDIPLRPSAELSLEELQRMADRDEQGLPPLAVSLLPIVLPVLLIAGKTVFDMATRGVPLSEQPDWVVTVKPLIGTLGNKNLALVVAAAISLATLAVHKRTSREQMSSVVQTALSGGGIIILITAAGGAFGHVLRQTGIASDIQFWLPVAQTALLPLAFAITAIVRIAQGSATVAMITAVGIVAPLASASELAFHPLYLALAIGCGSKPIPWMNDSGFWIVCRMSGMNEVEMLKTFSVALTLMGFVGLGVVMAMAAIWPLV